MISLSFFLTKPKRQKKNPSVSREIYTEFLEENYRTKNKPQEHTLCFLSILKVIWNRR